jgi:hypothetical protein
MDCFAKAARVKRQLGRPRTCQNDTATTLPPYKHGASKLDACTVAALPPACLPTFLSIILFGADRRYPDARLGSGSYFSLCLNILLWGYWSSRHHYGSERIFRVDLGGRGCIEGV